MALGYQFVRHVLLSRDKEAMLVCLLAMVEQHSGIRTLRAAYKQHQILLSCKRLELLHAVRHRPADGIVIYKI